MAAKFTVEDDMKAQWEHEQTQLKGHLLIEDVDDWAKRRITVSNGDHPPSGKPLTYIGGVDLSFIIDDHVNACAALVVLKLPELEIVYKDLTMVELTAPYVPGFLAFREAEFLIAKVSKLKSLHPEMMPQVILVDGNGILHPRGFGLACHLGVCLDIPTIGVAKKLFQVDGLEKNQQHKDKVAGLKRGGDTFPLIGDSGRQLGTALRSCNTTQNPVYVSPGHKISHETAVWVVHLCCKHRVPEPVRQADILSRAFLRDNAPASGAERRRAPRPPKPARGERPEGVPAPPAPGRLTPPGEPEDLVTDVSALWREGTE